MISRKEGDKIAIPLFALSTYYFLMKQKRNNIENILFIFSASGLVLDSYWTYYNSV